MNGKTIIAAIVGAIVAFLLGWVVWGMLLMDYYNSNMVQYQGLMLAEPKLWAIFASNFVMALLMAWLFTKLGATSFGSGFQYGMILGLTFSLVYDLFTYGQMNLFSSPGFMAVDIVINTLFNGVIGGIISLILGSGKKATA